MIHGFVEPGFEPVRTAFQKNFDTRGEVGAGLVVRHHGEVVVDLWGGIADPESGRTWENDTPCVVFSATKGMVATAMLMLQDRGDLDLDLPVADYWPEFAQAGKERITVRMLLNHRAGLSAVDAPLDLPDFADPAGRVHSALIAQVPLWEPDTDQGYGATMWGAYTGELFRRVAGRSVGVFFAEEIAAPLGLDCWIGLPPERFDPVATLLPVPPAGVLRYQLREAVSRRTSDGRLFRRVVAGKRSIAGKALLNPNMGKLRFNALNDPSVLEMELPWMGGVCTANSLSHMYAAVIGEVDGVRLVSPEAVRPLRHRQTWSLRDRVLQKPVGWSQGFLKEERKLYSPNPASFGHSGAGGSVGWADPDAELAIGYVMNRMDWRIRSPRSLELCHAIYACV